MRAKLDKEKMFIKKQKSGAGSMGSIYSDSSSSGDPSLMEAAKADAAKLNRTYYPPSKARGQGSFDDVSPLQSPSVTPTSMMSPARKAQPLKVAEKTLEEVEAELAKKRVLESLHLPSSWTRESPIQLFPPSEMDTTDTSLRIRGQPQGFDGSGYAEGRGLQRLLFYTTPYLTCMSCNALTFINVTALRSVLSLSKDLDPSYLPAEILPACTGCGETTSLAVGAKDFMLHIKATHAGLLRARAQRNSKARKIQAFYRAYLSRRQGRAVLAALLTTFFLHDRCATAIQSAGRGRLSRRALITERYLYVLKNAHPALLRWALHECPERCAVFWYVVPAELALVYADYRQLVERTGFRPPRIVVEANIKELASRVNERLYHLTTRVQRRWRGIMARRFIEIFHAERRRLRQLRNAVAFVLQRAYRGYVARRRVKRLRAADTRDHLLKEYTVERRLVRDADKRPGQRLMKEYSKERETEAAARSLGLIEPRAFGGNRMMALHASVYGSDDVTQLMTAHLNRTRAIVSSREAEQQSLQDRAAWVISMENKNRLYTSGGGYFSAEEKPQTASGAAKLASTNKDARRHLVARKCKYVYPAGVNNNPLAILKDKHASMLAAQGIQAASGVFTTLLPPLDLTMKKMS